MGVAWSPPLKPEYVTSAHTTEDDHFLLHPPSLLLTSLGRVGSYNPFSSSSSFSSSSTSFSPSFKEEKYMVMACLELTMYVTWTGLTPDAKRLLLEACAAVSYF